MKSTHWILITAALLGTLLLSACQGGFSSTAGNTQPTDQPTPIPLPEASDTPAPGNPNVILPTPTAAQETPGVANERAPDPAVQTVRDYFADLEAKDSTAAANLLSSFSLTVDGMTRGDGSEELHRLMQSGTEWSGLRIEDVQPFGDQVRLVHVTYTLTTQDPQMGKPVQTVNDELWPVRLENNRWLYNRNNLIDFRTLDVPYQSAGGLRIQPLVLARYSDRMRLTMLVQNTTNDTIVLGQSNEILATFTFGDQTIQADQNQLVFTRLHSYPDAAIEVHGLFAQYPDRVSIRQWKDYNVAPWFTFHFSE